jgi:hypothetical protein
VGHFRPMLDRLDQRRAAEAAERIAKGSPPRCASWAGG